MRNTIATMAVVALTLGMNAQNETFTIPTEAGGELRGQYVVIEELGTAQENYNKVINYINKSYNTPSEVIKSQIEGKYIRIQGTSKMFGGAGATYHTIEFKFKEDRIQVKLLNLEGRFGATVSPTIAFCTYDKTHKADGRVKKSSMKIATKILAGVNELLETTKIGIAKESSDSSEDEW
tara:strand:- start:72 stop:608 length:537 start_codon:yes stop_codon:yes gene_type:complete